MGFWTCAATPGHLPVRPLNVHTAMGVCVGASTLSVALVAKGDHGEGTPSLRHLVNIRHEGDPERTLRQLLDQENFQHFDAAAATGGRFTDRLTITRISEPRAVEQALGFVGQKGAMPRLLVSAGAESFLGYRLDEEGRIIQVLAGNKCATGAGEFFLQQIARLDLSLEEVDAMALPESPYPLSGRCSVFCKSDCTHAANKGVERERIAAGLGVMMADRVRALIPESERGSPVWLVGGCARNTLMRAHLQQEGVDIKTPEPAQGFEALGAALFALDNATAPWPGWANLLRPESPPATSLPPLAQHTSRVTFRTIHQGRLAADEEAIIGLDVGSTTTKALILRRRDLATVASVYLRTNGDPVGAARSCYRALAKQLGGRQSEAIGPPRIIGLGVTGSGRELAGLHGDALAVVNEITAHAAAAAFFDPTADTLLEIGGQDAKFTRLSHGVAVDYVMNEACSAGTGSFLEEACRENLSVEMDRIADLALAGQSAPTFSDQCSAFIAADIKGAIHSGRPLPDIVAGLVYAVCLNYLNRVKGSRPVGQRILMQGGVCYNRAVPLAMAGLLKKQIIVPPDPGLMGALGVALTVIDRLESGEIQPRSCDLNALVERTAVNGRSFFCPGTREACDRNCAISIYRIQGRNVPFGGACNKYEGGVRKSGRIDPRRHDWTRRRSELLFESAQIPVHEPLRGRIGLNRSFLTHHYFPLYSAFFSALGFETVLPDHPSAPGIARRQASFCFPGELSHGFFHTLIQGEDPPDFLFLPHFRAMPALEGQTSAQSCPLVQAEPSYLRAAFRTELSPWGKNGERILSPVLDLTEGVAHARQGLLGCAQSMGLSKGDARKAWRHALARQQAFEAELSAMGTEALNELEADPNASAVVLFSRPYGGLADEANRGIPLKFASRGVTILPFDVLPASRLPAQKHMYWGNGQRLLKAARFVAAHPQLHPLLVTYFSCGPDAFISPYFRRIIKDKPALILELDSHAADAGLETRIEAFLDVTARNKRNAAAALASPFPEPTPFSTAKIHLAERGGLRIENSQGDMLRLDDPRVTVLVPWVGRFFTAALAAALRGAGFKTTIRGPADASVMQRGRALTNGKECLPLTLTVGMLFDQLDQSRSPGEVLVYFMPTASGPCRFGQYAIFMEQMIQRRRIPDVALLSLTSENSYGGLGSRFTRATWWGIVLSDLMEEIRALLLAAAREPAAATAFLDREWAEIIEELEAGSLRGVARRVETLAQRLATIPLARPIKQTPLVALSGEIYVRRDPFSRNGIIEWLARRGFAALCTGTAEWVHYSDRLVDADLVDPPLKAWQRPGFLLRKQVMANDERRLRRALAPSGLIPPPPPSLTSAIKAGSAHIPLALTGEAILTVGNALLDARQRVCGVLAIGPFGCMPNRISEAVLNPLMTRDACGDRAGCRPPAVDGDAMPDGPLPFLALETDGSPWSQTTLSRLDAFCLQAERRHQQLLAEGPTAQDSTPLPDVPIPDAFPAEAEARPSRRSEKRERTDWMS